MKSLVLLAVVVLSVNAVSFEDVLLQEWSLFKARFNKSYETAADDFYRMKIFRNNKYDIAKHNIKYQTGEESYELGINQFSDMLPEEVDMIYNGYNKENRLRARDGEEPVLPDVDGEPFELELDSAPASVNWVSSGAITPVRQQGSCGSCYAFSALAALEGHIYIKSKKKVTLSPQQIVDCSSAYGNHGCNGGWPSNVYNYIKDNGVNDEASYPYEGRQGKCRMNKNKIAARCNGYVSVPQGSEEQLKSATAIGPVAVAVDASLSSFQQYRGGVYSDPKCSSTRLGHAVTIVGYGTDSATKKDFWIIKNSWGTGWGERGYMRIARNARNLCGVATRAVYPKV